MISPLDLEGRARESALTGFTLFQAVGEAMGYASTCWDKDGVFESVKASAAVDDLLQAIAKLTEIAINQQSIDALANTSDWELTELIFQAPVMGYAPVEP